MLKNNPSVLGPLLRPALEAVLQVACMCLVGWLLAKKNLLKKATQKQLNQINVAFLTPSFLFSKVAFSLSPSKLRELWIIALIFILTASVSMLVAHVTGVFLGLRRPQRNFAKAASLISNSNTLPFALMLSFVKTVDGLKWGRNDSHDEMLARALSYLVLYATCGMMVRWSYGVRLLAQSDEEKSELEDSPRPTATVRSRRPAFRAIRSALNVILEFMTMPLYATLASIIVALIPPLQHALAEDVPALKGFLTEAGSCAIPLNMLVLGAYFYQEPEKHHHIDTRGDEGNHLSSAGMGTGADIESAHGDGQSSTVGLKSPLGVPNYGAVQETRQSANDGNGSECATGITVTVIHSDLSSPMDGNVREGETKTVLAAIISRMILTPMIVLPTMAAFAMMDLHPTFKDPVFVCSIILDVSAPPALTLGQITHANAGKALERLITRTIFWSYCLFTPPLTLLYIISGLLFSRPKS